MNWFIGVNPLGEWFCDGAHTIIYDSSSIAIKEENILQDLQVILKRNYYIHNYV